jgi:ADP-dependent NAD(P)H-hydrate dehydratase / NAD(P)H-hydrate epimerase
MKILTAQQMREADAYTIKNEPIASIDLMERAAEACQNYLRREHTGKLVKVFCGVGNNGGDGLALGHLLKNALRRVNVYIIKNSNNASDDFITNEKRFKSTPTRIHYINGKEDFPNLTKEDFIIDAIFGIGLSRTIEGLAAEVVNYINASGARVISIDMPSGLFADEHTGELPVIHATKTLTFQCPKLAFFFPENAERVGEWEVLDIGLDKTFIAKIPSLKTVITKELIKTFLKTRKKFSHKGDYGHALLIAGGWGKMGAAVMMTKACLRMGTGLTTVHVSKHGVPIIQTAAPEAMAQIDFHEKYFTDNIEPEKYTAVGVGPGIGTEEGTQTALKHLMLYEKKVPLMLDADALNIIAANKDWLRIIPRHSILTPHPKEFERLTYRAANDFARHKMQIEFSKEHQVYVVLKGAHTCITTPEGEAFFNMTGNAGMAKGGSGDALAGMLTGLLAQGYSSLESCLIGVYMHGMAGDIAAKEIGMDGMTAGDIIGVIPKAWEKLRETENT